MMNINTQSSQTNETPDDEVIVIGKRVKVQSANADHSSQPTIILRSGHTDHPGWAITEFFRGLVVTQTNYDFDESFSPKQKEISHRLLEGLAQSSKYSAALASASTKGADINIIADYSGNYTFGNHGITVGMNDDGTIDQGEIVTIYINMNYGGQPISNFLFAEILLHELVHTLGVPSLAQEMHAGGVQFDQQNVRNILSGYDWQAAPSATPIAYDVIGPGGSNVPIIGTANFDVISGSEFADTISPGNGGSLIYSGSGNDTFNLVIGNGIDEIIDGGGSDTISFGNAPIASISTRWLSDNTSFAVIVGTSVEAIIHNAASSGVEAIFTSGGSYALASLPSAQNSAPESSTVQQTLYGAFYGGAVANAAVSDVNGDTLTYSIQGILGDCGDLSWSIDSASGTLFANFSRSQQDGNAHTFVTVRASDGLEFSDTVVTIRWANEGDVDTPIGFSRSTEGPWTDVSTLMIYSNDTQFE